MLRAKKIKQKKESPSKVVAGGRKKAKGKAE
jgi:hypothetical protein